MNLLKSWVSSGIHYLYLDIVNNYSILICSAVFSFLIFTFLIDGFKFSDTKIINLLQKILLIGLLFVLYLIFFSDVVFASDGSEADTIKAVNRFFN